MKINRSLYVSRNVELLLCKIHERDGLDWEALLAALDESRAEISNIKESDERIERNRVKAH